jgi:hypothetical protein
MEGGERGNQGSRERENEKSEKKKKWRGRACSHVGSDAPGHEKAERRRGSLMWTWDKDLLPLRKELNVGRGTLPCTLASSWACSQVRGLARKIVGLLASSWACSQASGCQPLDKEAEAARAAYRGKRDLV